MNQPIKLRTFLLKDGKISFEKTLENFSELFEELRGLPAKELLRYKGKLCDALVLLRLWRGILSKDYNKEDAEFNVEVLTGYIKEMEKLIGLVRSEENLLTREC